MAKDYEALKFWMVLGVATAVGIGGYLISFSIEYPKSYVDKRKYIPQTEQVQQGYVIPNKLEIDLQDLDGNGEQETVLKYDGKQYLLRLDEKGRPKIQE